MMNDYLKKLNEMTIEELLNAIAFYNEYKQKEKINEKMMKSIFNPQGIDYQTLQEIIPFLNEEDISFILKYDKDYKISFLLSLVNIADEEDLTKQAIYLLKRHNLNYILPLLSFVDEEEVQDAYQLLYHKHN